MFGNFRCRAPEHHVGSEKSGGHFIASPWPAITAALKRAKTRTAVTAYLTSSAEKILPLKGKADRLFVDASPKTVAAGLTDSNVIEKFMERAGRMFPAIRLAR